MMTWTQADWTHGSPRRAELFAFVCRRLNSSGRTEFVVQDGPTGPLIRHLKTQVRIGLRPSQPANPVKPFDIWVRLTHRFPMRADGDFNRKLLLHRVSEVTAFSYPEF